MRNEAVAPFLNWEHKYIRQLVIVSTIIVMTVSLGFQSYVIYTEINDLSELSHSRNIHSSAAQTEKKLKINDFELLFGFNKRPEAPPAKADIPKTQLNLTLLGALAAIQQGTESSAIIQGANQGKVYQIGDTLPGGAILSEIHADHVVLKRNGQLEILPFPDIGRDSKGIEPVPQNSHAQPYATPGSGYTEQPGSDSLEERMRKLREQLQQANQGS